MIVRQPVHAPLLPLCACLMAGIAAGYYFPLCMRLLFVLLIIIVPLTALLYRFRRLQSGGIALCTILIGMLLTVIQVDRLHTPPLSHDLIIISPPIDKGKTIVMDALTADGKKVRLRMMKDAPVTLGGGLTVDNDSRPITYYPLYFDSHGYSGEVFAGYGQWRGKEVSTSGLSLLQRVRLRMLLFRERLLENYRQQGLDQDAYAIAAAMTLGDKTSLTQELRETYSITGASHVLALSGLHLGIIYWFVTLLTVGRRWRILSQTATILLLWTFAFLTGLAPSIIRAALMLTVYALLSIGYRNKTSINVLAFTAICMLAAQPLMLFDISFQLSFMAVFSILLFFPLLNSVFSAHYLQEHWLLRWIWGLTVLSVAAQIGTAPLVAYHFGRFSCYFLLTNFIVVPGAYLIIGTALLLLVMQHAVIASVLAGIITGTTAILSYIAVLPGASIDHLHPSLLQTMLLYVVIACLYVLWHILWKNKSI